jgi:hypothetical protein
MTGFIVHGGGRLGIWPEETTIAQRCNVGCPTMLFMSGLVHAETLAAPFFLYHIGFVEHIAPILSLQIHFLADKKCQIYNITPKSKQSAALLHRKSTKQRSNWKERNLKMTAFTWWIFVNPSPRACGRTASVSNKQYKIFLRQQPWTSFSGKHLVPVHNNNM